MLLNVIEGKLVYGTTWLTLASRWYVDIFENLLF